MDSADLHGAWLTSVPELTVRTLSSFCLIWQLYHAGWQIMQRTFDETSFQSWGCGRVTAVGQLLWLRGQISGSVQSLRTVIGQLCRDLHFSLFFQSLHTYFCHFSCGKMCATPSMLIWKCRHYLHKYDPSPPLELQTFCQTFEWCTLFYLRMWSDNISCKQLCFKYTWALTLQSYNQWHGSCPARPSVPHEANTT